MTHLPTDLMLPPRTLSGAGKASAILPESRAYGDRGMLVCGRSLDRNGRLAHILDAGEATPDISIWRHHGGEPTLEQLEELLSAARGHDARWIAAIGGGSVMDLAKACAGLLEAPLPAVDHHNGAPLETSHIPFIAAPTTAGTGSEATSVSVLTNAQTGVKKSIRHSSHLPSLVILDHELLDSCPAPVIAASGMDALTQAIEAYISKGASWMSDQFALEGVRLIARAIPNVYAGARGDIARELLLGSYLAGLALSNARLGVVHGLAHPLGARYKLPHGLVCAIALPLAIRFNRSAMGPKYSNLSDAMGGDLLKRVDVLMHEFHIESPFPHGEPPARKAIIAETLASGSTAANPRPVEANDVDQMLNELFAV